MNNPDPPKDPDPNEPLQLSLEETARLKTVGGKARSGATGYNPYDAVTPARKPAQNAQPQRKPTDLRKLSEWIRLQQQVEALKKDKP